MDINDIRIQINFPNLNPTGYRVTSPITPSYNCIAWAAGDNTRFWWPDAQNTYYWPSNAPREETLEAFITLFDNLGFEECSSDGLEDGYEKVAIYTSSSGKPTHAARQLSSGKWTSKLGSSKDIEHTLDGLTSATYGNVSKIMRRKLEYNQ